MIRYRLAGFPNAVAGNAAHATGTDGAEGNGTQNVNAQSLVERLSTYGFNADTVSLSVPWFLPFAHQRSIAPLASGVTISWPL